MKSVQEIAVEVREAVEALAEEGGWSPDLTGLCAIASCSLFTKLKGLKPLLHYGTYTTNLREKLVGDHCWVTIPTGIRFERTIVDVTATQFNYYNKSLKCKPIEIVPATNKRYTTLSTHSSIDCLIKTLEGFEWHCQAIPARDSY